MPPTRHGTRFSIAYAGSIYLDRDPRLLFRATARVIARLGITPERRGLDFIGNVENYDGVPVSQIAREEGIAQFVTVGPSRPRPAMLDFLMHATMLVSLPQDSDLTIPSKIFEYMQFDACLLALAKHGSATELLLRDSGADVVAPLDVDAMAALITIVVNSTPVGSVHCASLAISASAGVARQQFCSTRLMNSWPLPVDRKLDVTVGEDFLTHSNART